MSKNYAKEKRKVYNKIFQKIYIMNTKKKFRKYPYI